MIRAIRPNAMARDDASLISGWNIAPNLAYTVALLPGSSSCGVLLYDETGTTLIATGAALVGTAQPCVLLPQAGLTVGMVDADLGWHLRLTTTGAESQRTIRIGPAVDLPDEIHPVYGEDTLALARAKAAIDAAAHYIDDVTVTCPLGLGAGLGDVVSVPVDGVVVVGQVESITWTATPDATTETAVIRRHVAIAPEPVVEITPPTVSDHTGTATHLVGTSGNVLANDEAGLTITAVNGLSANVGASVDGDNGGTFTIAANGTWTFNPAGDFALLEGEEIANTSVTYHASDGTAEAMATLTVTVSRANAAPVAANDIGETDAATTTSGNVLTNDADADLDSLTVSQVAGSAVNVGVAVAGSDGGLFTVHADGSWAFDPHGDFGALTGEDMATTSVTYHVSDGVAEDEGALTVTVTAASAPTLWTPAEITTLWWPDMQHDNSSPSLCIDRSGNSNHLAQANASYQPQVSGGYFVFDGADDVMCASEISASPGVELFFVAKQAKTGGARNGPLVYMTSFTTYQPHWGGGPDNPALQGWYETFFTTNQYLVASSVPPGIYLGSLRHTGTEIVGNLNGVDVGAVSAPFSGTADTVCIGGGSSNVARNEYAELILVQSPSPELRQKIYGYLAHRHGLVDDLPADSPYKTAAPTT